MVHWDVLLRKPAIYHIVQSKYIALDFFEERKWKKALASILATQCANKFKHLKTKKKLDELYKRCMCMYLSMTVNNNMCDVTQGHDNMKIKGDLSNYIKRVSNVEYFHEIFEHWKIALIDIKAQLDKKFGNIKKAKHFLKVIELMENMIKVQEENIKPEAENTYIDFKTLDIEMKNLFQEITDELNSDEKFRSTNELIYSNQSTSLRFSEDDILNDLNPKQIFFNAKDFLSNDVNEFKLNYEKKPDTKVEALPVYDYCKIAGSEVDINKDIEELEVIFNKVFQPLFYAEKTKQDKILLEQEIDIYKTKNEKVIKDQDALKLYNLKFEHFTTFQHLTLLWGLIHYGMNKSILADIPNIFSFSRSISFEPEEIFNNLDTQLQSKYNIDLLVSNVDSLGGYIKSDSLYIQPLDPPMLNSIHYNFYYNKKMLEYVNYNQINNGFTDQTDNEIIILNPSFTSTVKKHEVISLLDNPIFNSQKDKNEIYNKLTKEISNMIEKIKNKYIQTEHALMNLKKVK
jgi:hypothetical protein